MSLASGNQFVFIFAKLSFNNLFYKINGYIHIIAGLLRADNVSFYRNGHFNLLTFFFHTECYDNFCFRSEIPFKFS